MILIEILSFFAGGYGMLLKYFFLLLHFILIDMLPKQSFLIWSTQIALDKFIFPLIWRTASGHGFGGHGGFGHGGGLGGHGGRGGGFGG